MCRHCNHSHAQTQDNKQITCENCGKLITADEAEPTNTGHICPECAEDEYCFCDNCRVYVRSENMRVDCRDENGCYENLCNDCLLDLGYQRCDDCGEYVSARAVYTDDYDTHVCRDCYERHDWHTCTDCGRLLRYDETVWASDGAPYCEECYTEARSEYIHCYHNGAVSGLQFHRTENEADVSGARYFGIELEVDDARDSDAIADCYYALNGTWETNQDTHAHFEEDGSLECGFEIIT